MTVSLQTVIFKGDGPCAHARTVGPCVMLKGRLQRCKRAGANGCISVSAFIRVYLRFPAVRLGNRRCTRMYPAQLSAATEEGKTTKNTKRQGRYQCELPLE